MHKEPFEVIVENVQLLDSVPSGSGIAFTNESVYIIGDDATALYILHSPTAVTRNIPIINTDTAVYRIDKPDKHDLECVALAERNQQPYLLAFGSGSLSPQRDALLIVSLKDPADQQWVPLGMLYRQLRSVSGSKELNLEGAVINKDRLYLFNRSGNEIFQLSLSEFFEVIDRKGAHPVSNIQRFSLALPGHASLSGGCMAEDKILFCASAEDAPNAYDDGEISGSYIGTIDIGGAEPKLEFISAVKDKLGIVLKDKIESVDVAGRYSNGDLKILAITDNDDGMSKLIALRIRFGT